MICTVFCNTWTWRRRRMEAKRPPSMTSRGRSYVFLDMRGAVSFSDLVTPFRYSSVVTQIDQRKQILPSFMALLDPEAQVIAEAIAIFQYNNRMRVRMGQRVLDTMTIPCITMTGTRPIFCLVPVTQELSQAVATAQYPTNSTVVKKCVVASNSHRLSEGMEIVDFRQVALQHYTAFRTLAESHWSVFIFATEMGV